MPFITNQLTEYCQQVLADYPASRYMVGYSGGRDSHVLLDMLCQLRQTGQLTTAIIAIHINHRLQKQADEWVKHCQEVCRTYNIPLIVGTVKARPKAGQSLEAFARDQRYALIKQHLRDGEVFLSAHHQRDQAETFLLQLMRGSGLDGLRAMPLDKPFGAGQYLRPLLNVDYDNIVQYAAEKQLSFIVDNSNDDRRFNRNFIRHEILPALKKRFPRAEAAIARSAAWLAEVPVTDAPEKLQLSTLKTYSLAKQKQQLRAFVKNKTALSLSQKQTDYILNHHVLAAADKHPQLRVEDYIIRRFSDEIIITAAFPEASFSRISDKDFLADIILGREYHLDKIASLHWRTGQGGVVGQTYQLRRLNGVARFHPHTRRHSTTVKKLLHEAGIAPWLRPLYFGLYSGEELVAIPGVGVAQSHYTKNSRAMMPIWIIAQKFVRL